jgi:alpha-beta hydrolase superfamily lysophospholipase
MTAVPTWFGPADRPLFGWVHVPEDNRAAGAVVLCPPVARELAATQICYRQLAEELSAAGMLAIRFDYDGTGDSTGVDLEPNRVDSWLGGIEQAIDLAKSCGAESISLIGMRVGALLVAVAAARRGSIDAVVLWDPCESGRAFVRQESVLMRLLSDDNPGSVDGIELPGVVFSTETVSDLGSLAVPADGARPSRVLLLTRPDRQPATKLTDALGTEPDLAEARGQELLLEVEPGSRKTPHDVVEHIVSWLHTGNPASRRAVRVCAQDAARVPFEGGRLTERAIRLGPAGLFAIATEPNTPIGAPTVLMLNAGPDWHVGPNRLWVDLSRRWAAAGFRCVRFDESGIGDSPARPEKPANLVRSPDAFDDVRDARFSVEPDDPTNVILVGLCSGGYQALEDALVRPTRAIYAINPVLHFAPPELATGPMDPRRRICWPLSGLASTYRSWLAEPVRRRLRKVLWRSIHLLNRDRGRDASMWLEQLRIDGVEVFVVCGQEEARPFGTAPTDTLGSTTEHDSIRFDVIEGLDGALMPAWQRGEVSRRLTDHLLGHFVPAEERPIAQAASA